MQRRCYNAVIVCAVVGAGAALWVAPVSGAAGGAAAPAPLAMRVTAVQGPKVAREPLAAALPNIDPCLARLDPQLDIGFNRIAARCPDLVRQLEGGAWAPWLPRGWKESGNDFSAGGLRELRELIEREIGSGESSGVAAPDVRTLQPILTTLSGGRSETGWSRFKSWLRSLLERREQPANESWFARMVSQVGISQSLIQLITYGALGAVVILAAVIVSVELRAAKLIPRRPNRPLQRREPATGATRRSWNEIEAADLRDRPRLLLELIVQRLGDRKLLPPSGALTVRELTNAALLSEADDRARLEDLALASERVRYSSSLQSQSEGGLVESIARGRELLGRLDASAPR